MVVVRNDKYLQLLPDQLTQRLRDDETAQGASLHITGRSFLQRGATDDLCHKKQGRPALFW